MVQVACSVFSIVVFCSGHIDFSCILCSVNCTSWFILHFFLIDDFVLFLAFFVLSSKSVFFVINYVGSLYFHNFSFLMWCKIMFCLCSLPFDDLFSLVRGGILFYEEEWFAVSPIISKTFFLVTLDWSKQPKTFNQKTISLYRCPKRPWTRESEAKDKRPPLTPRLKK